MDDLMGLLKRAEGEAEERLNRVRGARHALEGRAKPGRKPVSAEAQLTATAPPKKRRRRGKSKRADQALALVTAKPGITAAKIADEMGIKSNYLYRVMGELVDKKQVVKTGRTYAAVETA